MLFSVCGKCSSEGKVRGWCGDTESFRLVWKKKKGSTESLLRGSRTKKHSVKGQLWFSTDRKQKQKLYKKDLAWKK